MSGALIYAVLQQILRGTVQTDTSKVFDKTHALQVEDGICRHSAYHSTSHVMRLTRADGNGLIRPSVHTNANNLSTGLAYAIYVTTREERGKH